MSNCEALSAVATDGVAAALQAVDCMASQSTASAFNRLFAAGGALAPALTILLTLYVAFFAFSLLTGRSRLGVAMLNKHSITLGLVLTFATSWVAYQGVVWNLAVGAPDYLAGVLIGSQGSASQLFGNRIDILFAAIAEAASSDAIQAGAAPTQSAAGAFTPGNVMWIAAILLLLGTVGALITARIALAVLLAVGPVFIVFALFRGTRGLFVGWLRGTVMVAVVPLFAVLGGGFMIELTIPIIVNLQGPQGIDGKSAIGLFVLASVHMALMVIVFRVLGTMVGAWSIFGMAAPGNSSHGDHPGRSRSHPVVGTDVGAQYPARGPVQRGVALASAAVASSAHPRDLVGDSPLAQSASRRQVGTAAAPLSSTIAMSTMRRERARGIGSRYRPLPKLASEIMR